MFYLTTVAIAAALASATLPDPLAAGWKGIPVCERLHEDTSQRVLRCTFPPGIGHDRGTAPAVARHVVNGHGTRAAVSAAGLASQHVDASTQCNGLWPVKWAIWKPEICL